MHSNALGKNILLPGKVTWSSTYSSADATFIWELKKKNYK